MLVRRTHATLNMYKDHIDFENSTCDRRAQGKKNKNIRLSVRCDGMINKPISAWYRWMQQHWCGFFGSHERPALHLVPGNLSTRHHRDWTQFIAFDASKTIFYYLLFYSSYVPRCTFQLSENRICWVPNILWFRFFFSFQILFPWNCVNISRHFKRSVSIRNFIYPALRIR